MCECELRCAFWIQSSEVASPLNREKEKNPMGIKAAADFTSLWQSDYMSYFKPVQLSPAAARGRLFFLHLVCETAT